MPPEDVIAWTRRQQPNPWLPGWAHRAETPEVCRLLAIATEHHLSACASCEQAAKIAFGDISIAGRGQHACRFEGWYATEGRERYGEHPDYARLGEAHARTHQTEGLACNLCKKADAGCEIARSAVTNASIREAQRAFFELFWAVVMPPPDETQVPAPSQPVRNVRERAIAGRDVHQRTDGDPVE
ncbi:CZB domain-containing protein [Acidihalobacter prosperus]|uniref:CZB domain-containing protein n=1 Tax=Acidihalobacter prosperus TaxID=160660 RepID=UPI001F2AA855|nr:CZB domain-containing protein [Acidihalobacter prosperus]